MDLRIRKNLPSFFNPLLLSYTKLPTYIEIYNSYIFIKIKNSKKSKNETIKRLMDIWKEASIPSYNEYYIFKKLTKYINIVDNLLKSRNRKNYHEYVKNTWKYMISYSTYAHVNA